MLQVLKSPKTLVLKGNEAFFESQEFLLKLVCGGDGGSQNYGLYSHILRLWLDMYICVYPNVYP